MASAQIQTLLKPPSTDDARKRTQGYLNTRFKSLEDLEHTTDFESVVADYGKRSEDMKSEVRNLSCGFTRRPLDIWR